MKCDKNEKSDNEIEKKMEQQQRPSTQKILETFFSDDICLTFVFLCAFEWIIESFALFFAYALLASYMRT